MPTVTAITVAQPYRWINRCCGILMMLSLSLLSACQTTQLPSEHRAATAMPTIAPVQIEKPEPVVSATTATPQPIAIPQPQWSPKPWNERNLKPVHIGVILPLHGRYGRYGQTLLDGIRLAISDPVWGHLVKLTVIDAAGGPTVAARAYQQLIQQRANWVIGPLLKENVEALIPLLRNDVPVISLSKHVALAERHPALFIHSIARGIQARFMARQAIKAGMHRIAIITGKSRSEQAEANAFGRAFSEAGGEIAGTLTLDKNNVNYINRLKTFRAVTDNEEQLRDLDLDLQLFAPLRRLDIRIPPGVDALYLATPGSMVAKLAGQLAYVDLRHIAMLGSNRWMDGHLLDDSGRYLTAARFCQPAAPINASKLVTQYRETWGEGSPGALFALGYDTANLPLLLGSRLGLEGKLAIQGLHDQAGFPAASGKVRFNPSGVAEKDFDIFMIKDAQVLLSNSKG
jgi:ABC-type branched-subunit amino acid transport system substrate-binding protein